jgi:hypothetical protein
VAGNEQLHKAWKEANDVMRVAEHRLTAAWAAFAAGSAGPPDKELLEEVARLRRECDKRLAAILDSYPNPGKPRASPDSDHPSASR